MSSRLPRSAGMALLSALTFALLAVMLPTAVFSTASASALSTVSTAASSMPGQAAEAPGARDRTGAAASRKTVIARKHLTTRGGTVRASNGVAITVPPGVMKFPGTVTITDLGDNLYDIHIYAKWHGKVEIRLPKIEGRNVIMHEVRDGKWRLEDARSDGPLFATAKVTSLSNFWNLLGCFKQLRPSPGSAVNVAKCLANVGVRMLPEWMGKQIIKYFGDYDGCNFNASSWSIDWIQIITTPCNTDSPSCESTGSCYPQDPGTGGGGGGTDPGASGGGGYTPQPAPAISLARGGNATYGYWYSVWMSGFAPGSQITLACHDSVDRNFWTQTFTISGDGTAGDSTLCYSGDGPDHWVTGGGVESNHVAW